VFFFLSVVGAGCLNLLAKLAFGRTRPDLWVSIAPEADYSFPSGHAMATMAMGAAVICLAWPTRQRWVVVALAVPFVIGIGLSRLYLGVHFPSDILGGWCASVAWVSGLNWIRLAHEKRRAEIKAVQKYN
jgi:undecaprenyl-diphosphatase